MTVRHACAGGQLLGYYLKEESGWSMDIAEVRKQVQAARDRGIAVRAVVFINPGAAHCLILCRPRRHAGYIVYNCK